MSYTLLNKKFSEELTVYTIWLRIPDSGYTIREEYSIAYLSYSDALLVWRSDWPRVLVLSATVRLSVM